MANKLRGIWAADLLVVQTINYRVVYVLFFITHNRRELVHFKVTSNPNAAWIWQQLIEATPWGRRPDYLIHDRDAVYGRDFGARLSKLGITSVRTPFQAPRANAIAERLIRSIRQECLDHVIVINERLCAPCLRSSPITTTSTAPIEASGSKAPCIDRLCAMDR
jgi:transposase InsO family protein